MISASSNSANSHPAALLPHAVGPARNQQRCRSCRSKYIAALFSQSGKQSYFREGIAWRSESLPRPTAAQSVAGAKWLGDPADTAAMSGGPKGGWVPKGQAAAPCALLKSQRCNWESRCQWIVSVNDRTRMARPVVAHATRPPLRGRPGHPANLSAADQRTHAFVRVQISRQPIESLTADAFRHIFSSAVPPETLDARL